MPGALYSRVKTWTTEVLTYADLNAEFDNILTNLVPLMIDDYSTDVTQMRVQTDPGESGSESLATSLGAELARLRYAIAEIKGTTYWYTTAGTTLAELVSALGTTLLANRIVSGRKTTLSNQALHLVPAGSGRTVTLKGATTSFVYVISGTTYTISTDVASGTLTAAPSTNNTCLVNDVTLTGQAHSKQLGEFDTVITVDTMGSEISALTGKLCGFKVGTEYFIAKVESTTQLTKAYRGFFFDSTDAGAARVALSDNDTITLLKLTWVFAKTDGTLAVCYTNPRAGASTPTSPAVGDYWFDTVNNLWKYYDSSSYVTANAILVGVAVSDATNTVGARSFDQFKACDFLNTLELEKSSNTEVRSKLRSGTVSVFGTTVKWTEDFVRWDITTDLVSGVTEAASTTYYLYLSETGVTWIDNKAPHDRTTDRRGYYHPFEGWRCVGEFFNNASSNINGVIAYANYVPRDSYSIVPSVSGNALTLTLTNENGDPITPTTPILLYNDDGTTNSKKLARYLRYPLILTVTSGATLGHPDNRQSFANIYAMETAGPTVTELAISSRLWKAGNLLTTTAMSNSADVNSVAYSLTARTAVPAVRIGFMTSTQTTAGTWAAAPTVITKDLPLVGPVAMYSSTNGQTVTRNAFSTVEYETVVVDHYANYNTTSGDFTASQDGVYSLYAQASPTAVSAGSNGAMRAVATLSAVSWVFYNGPSRTSGFVNSGNTLASFAGTIYMSAGDTVHFDFGFDDGAANRNLTADKNFNSMCIKWMGF